MGNDFGNKPKSVVDSEIFPEPTWFAQLDIDNPVAATYLREGNKSDRRYRSHIRKQNVELYRMSRKIHRLEVQKERLLQALRHTYRVKIHLEYYATEVGGEREIPGPF